MQSIMVSTLTPVVRMEEGCSGGSLVKNFILHIYLFAVESLGLLLHRRRARLSEKADIWLFRAPPTGTRQSRR